ncbi:MAG: AMP-binding protein [Sphaerochaetaceae bacterium]|nr:AMP-binding protein [Sphaerochaetaceae bacterium]
MKEKHDPKPWRYLDQFRGKEFQGEFPTIKETFHISAITYPERPCWTDPAKNGLKLTYAQAEEVLYKVSSWIRSKGVDKNTHIAVTGKNSPQWAVAFFSVQYAGCVSVPLDNTLHSAELENIVSFGDISMVFGDKERLDSITNRENLTLVCLEKCDEYPYVMDLEGPAELRAPEGDDMYTKVEDLAVMLFTSGTMGVPKGVMLSNRNLISCTYLSQGLMNVNCYDIYYIILPIHHAFALQADLLECMSKGSHLVFGKRLTVTNLLKEMKDYRVNILVAVPMLFNKMLKGLMSGIEKAGKFKYAMVRAMMGINGFLRDVFGWNAFKKPFKKLLAKLSFDNLKYCVSGGGALPPQTEKAFRQLGLDFVQGYGLTETSPITHLNPIFAYRKGSVGKACPGVEHKIVDPDSDGNGTLWQKGPRVMMGYYKNPEATREVLTEDGWFNTGDVGHIDEDDYLYLSGRSKNIIVTEGGKNVFPEEIEDLFQLYDELEQVCIVPYYTDKKLKTEGIRLLAVPSEKLKEEYKNVKSGIEKRINEIVKEINGRLQSYKKISKTTILDDPLQTTSSHKIKRAEVLKEFKPDLSDEEEKKN